MASLKILPVPSPPYDLKLSLWDKRTIAVYSKRILCFEIHDANTKKISELLLTALQSTVQELPFLAGSVTPLTKDQLWLKDLIPKGAAYLEIQDLSAEISFAELQNSGFSSALLDTEKLCPFTLPAYMQGDPVDVCRFRATFINGGLLLAVQVFHTVFDGRGITDMLKVFAANLCKAQRGELIDVATGINNKEDSKDIYSFNRSSVFSACGAAGTLDKHPCFALSPSRVYKIGIAKTICANIYVSCDSLRALKEAASPSSPHDGADKITYISSHDAVAALMWRGIMLARAKAGIISNDALIHFSQAVDCRDHLGLPQPYYGNAFYGILVSLPLATLAATSDNPSALQIPGLQAAARAIRGEVNSVTAEKVRDLLGYVERMELDHPLHLRVVEDQLFGSMFMASYFGFEMHEMDFGEALGGRIKAFRVPALGLAPGLPIVLPRLPDGSCEFVINEQEEVMKYLAEDEVFWRFARRVA